MLDPNTVRGLILDMDGVLWRGNQAIGDLKKTFQRIQRLDLKVILASNNAGPSLQDFLDKLAGFGAYLKPENILNSTMGAARYLQGQYPLGGPILAIGEAGMQQTLAEAGFPHTTNGHPLAVVAGIDREFTYQKLHHATTEILNGALFIATNTDRTFPIPGGVAPGAGAIIAAIQAATQVKPVIIGKPEPLLFKLCLDQLKLPPNQVVVVGDRLETDISGGQSAGCKTALVLSGISTKEQGTNWLPPIDWIGEDLNSLLDTIESAR